LKTVTLACLLSVQLMLSGCSNTSSSVTAVAKEKTLSLVGFRSIVVVVDRGDCKVSPDIVKRFGESYMNAAGPAGARVSASETATFRIESISDRGAGRLLIAAVAGPLAMTFHVDQIKGTLVAGGAEYPVDETARFPFVTIDSVAKDMGEIAFARLIGK
jgi:hypothetical protein